MANFVYIQQQSQLDLALGQLAKVPRIAIDTESSGYYTYFSELCLIQLSAMGSHYIIDPLAELNLDGLAHLCRAPGITKIFHSAASDIAELKRAYRWDFVNIFDTFLACRLLGHAACSLSSLVAEYEGVELEKKEQKSNWKQRPLTRSQLEYASLDTVYLENIMDKLKQKLESYGMYTEIAEEFERTCHIEVEPVKEINSEGWRRLPDVKQLSMEQQAILRTLYLLREERARKENIAPFRLLANNILLRLVKERPDNLTKPTLTKAFHPHFLKADAQGILKILKGENIDLAAVEPETRKTPKAGSEKKVILKKLKKWRNRVAEFRGIDPAMVISSRYLNIIAHRMPKTISELEEQDLLTPWKNKIYGPQILDIIAGKYDGTLPEGLSRLPE